MYVSVFEEHMVYIWLGGEDPSHHTQSKRQGYELHTIQYKAKIPPFCHKQEALALNTVTICM